MELDKRKILEAEVKERSLLSGHFLLNDRRLKTGFHSDECIQIRILNMFVDLWVPLMSDIILASSTAGVVGCYSSEGVSWIQLLAESMRRRGIEINFTEIYPNGEVRWGDPFKSYRQGAPVTVFTEVNTLGETLLDIKDIVKTNGLIATKAVSIVHRNPKNMDNIGGVSFTSAIHVPLSLYPLKSRRLVDICEHCETDVAGVRRYPYVTSLWS